MPTKQLNGLWNWLEDPQGTADQNNLLSRIPPGTKTVAVPGVWNIAYPDYHGPAVYYRTIRTPKTWAGQRIFLVCDGSNYLTRLYLDGVAVGSHEGGYTGFEFELTATLKAGHEQLLTIWVIHSPPRQPVLNTDLEDVASSKELWYYAYAGLWGGVRLETRPAVYIEDIFVDPCLARKCADVTLTLNGPEPISGTWSLVDGRGHHVAHGACADRWRIAIGKPHPWSPASPHLYVLTVTLANGCFKTVRFGLRDIAVKRDGFRLNGKEILIKGVLL
ncbi:MAG: hypothetical protein O3A51_12110, partial [Verrucomicrobia bacterium]|nr:hypothetical protein [Verrucomicrobiota bacterium]